MDEPISLEGRLGKLEGLMIGLQASITQSQTHFAAYASRIEGLEKRQIQLERDMMTRQDLAGLIQKVDAIAAKQSSQEGGSEATRWSLQQIVSWAGLVIAILTAVVAIDDRLERAPAPAPMHRSP